jgi:hypothetical protein
MGNVHTWEGFRKTSEDPSPHNGEQAGNNNHHDHDDRQSSLRTESPKVRNEMCYSLFEGKHVLPVHKTDLLQSFYPCLSNKCVGKGQKKAFTQKELEKGKRQGQ